MTFASWHPSTLELVATALFALAVLHTFATRYFGYLARLQPNHAGLWHLLGEVETVFGVWALSAGGPHGGLCLAECRAAVS